MAAQRPFWPVRSLWDVCNGMGLIRPIEAQASCSGRRTHVRPRRRGSQCAEVATAVRLPKRGRRCFGGGRAP